MKTTKPKVIRILGDNNVGGIRSVIESQLNSSLVDEFNFITTTFNDASSVLATCQPDLAIIHSASSWLALPQILSFKKHTKIIIQEHHYCESFEKIVPSLQRFRLMLKLSYSLANRVVAVSQAQSRWMLKHQLIRVNKLRIIPQTPCLERFLAVPQKHSFQPPFVLGAYGRFTLQKGFDLLLQALQLVPDLPVVLHLGGIGREEHRLRQLAEKLTNVSFLGPIFDVPSFLQACDAAIVPSRWEPWGIVCLEAKAAARPVIASSVDGLTEQMQDCGILVPPENPQALALAIASLVSQPQEQLILWGKNGRQSVREAWEHHLNEWKTLIWEMVGS